MKCGATFKIFGAGTASCEQSAGHNDTDPDDYHRAMYQGHLVIWKE